MVRESDLITNLLTKLEDGNAIVVANALAALTEISILSGENEIKIRSKTLKRILLALNESNEWGQVYILDSLINYTPKKEKSAELIIESVLARLSHANPAVVMSAIKVVLKFLDWIESPESVRNFCKKISNSLITIMSAGPEIQYVLLRSLHAIAQKRPYLLDKDFKHFYVKYNDPIYVKLEKIDILYKLADSKNFENILNELKSYAITEFDEDLIKRAIRYIGFIGYKNEKSLDHCVESIKEILEASNELTISEAMIVSRDLMRKYKGKSLEILKRIDEDLIKTISEPEGKSAVIFILGEFCTKIKNSVALIAPFVETFNEEVPMVKLQILNSVIKNYVNKPNDCEELVKVVLQRGGEETENPDVRDRAYIYWRLLEQDPDVAKEMISGEKPAFEFKEEIFFENNLADNIIENMTNISSVYHKTSKELIPKEDMIIEEKEEIEDNKSKEEENKKDSGKSSTNAKTTKSPKKPKISVVNVNVNDADLLGLDDDNINNNNQVNFNNFNMDNIMGNNNTNINNNNNNNLIDIMDIFGSSQPKAQNNLNNQNNFFDYNLNNNNNNDNDFNFIDPIDNSIDNNNFNNQEFNEKSIKIFDENNITINISSPKKVLDNNNLQIYSSFNREKEKGGKIVLGLYIKNKTSKDYSNFLIDTFPNSFALGFEKPGINQSINIRGNSHQYLYYTMIIDGQKNDNNSPNYPYSLGIKFSANGEKTEFNVPLLINCLFVESGKMSTQNFVEFFKANNNKDHNVRYIINNISQIFTNEEGLSQKFERNNIFLVAKQNKTDPPTTFYSCNVSNNLPVIVECYCEKEVPVSMKVKIIGSAAPIIPFMKEVIDKIFNDN
jgi:hypothetical protein